MYYLAALSYKGAQIAALYINAGNGNQIPTRVLVYTNKLATVSLLT